MNLDDIPFRSIPTKISQPIGKNLTLLELGFFPIGCEIFVGILHFTRGRKQKAPAKKSRTAYLASTAWNWGSKRSSFTRGL